MKAIGYFRVTSDMAGESLPSSLAEQKESFSRFCQERGYRPTMTFVEADRADGIGRAEFQRMLSYIRKQGEGLIIVVKSLDHLHPDPQEIVRCLLELDDLRARVVSIDEELTEPLSAALQVWSTHREGA